MAGRAQISPPFMAPSYYQKEELLFSGDPKFFLHGELMMIILLLLFSAFIVFLLFFLYIKRSHHDHHDLPSKLDHSDLDRSAYP
jgi:hypothetical protein